MESGPNDAFRFLLEIAGLAAIGWWGYGLVDGLVGVGVAIGLVLAVAFVWGVFRVPNDPGPAPVAIPGPLRLLLETVVFALAVVALADSGLLVPGAVLAVAVLVHYALARERVVRLLGRG